MEQSRDEQKRKMRSKFLISTVLSLLVVFSADALKREQRSTWMSAYTGCWPTSAIQSSNAHTHKRICDNNLDSLQRNHFTTIYYHVRPMADAAYNSKYEPWSKYVSGTRGTAPAFDPFEYLLTGAHKRGLAVYAWINPYRYMNSVYDTGYGDAGADLNYENSHPEWLIKWQKTDNGSTRTWTILNPALPEVTQRIVDVIADIVDKYDVDGIVFDDYFYQDGLPMSYDADNYNSYKNAGGTLSQGDWRRENVNSMVRAVNNYLKQNKPWVRFGISPAGVAMGTNLASIAEEKYGITACPGSDWQYNTIWSDPVEWLQEGSIDFISPQVYWTIGYSAADFGKITPWWYEVVNKFGRHCYISQSLSSRTASAFSTFTEEIDLTHTSVVGEAPGMVYFPWKTLKTITTRKNNKAMQLMEYLRESSFTTPALDPIVTWVKTTCPGNVSSVARDGRTITWNGPDNVRFTVYAVPKSVGMANFHKEEQYLKAVSYTKSYEIPAYDKNYPEYGIADSDLDNYLYAVAVYDRYGNEYSAVFEGETLTQSETPTLTFPINNAVAPSAFTFAWTGKASVFEIAIASDAAMENVLVKKELEGNSVAAEDLLKFNSDVTYYWRVTARDNNATEATSAVEAFTVDVFHITSPANKATGVSLTPTLTWTAAGSDIDYTLQIAKDSSFDDLVYTTTTKETTAVVPSYTLIGNTTYYARVLIANGVSETNVFTTENAVPSKPVITSPATSGATLGPNDVISVQPQNGVKVTRISVSKKNTFPARSSYNKDLTVGEFSTPALSSSDFSKVVTESGTYYARAYFQYTDADGKTQTTDWSDTAEFVYDANGSVDAIAAGEIRIEGGANPLLEASQSGLTVNVYSPDGRIALAGKTDATGRMSLASLQQGTYLVVVKIDKTKKTTLKFIRE